MSKEKYSNRIKQFFHNVTQRWKERCFERAYKYYSRNGLLSRHFAWSTAVEKVQEDFKDPLFIPNLEQPEFNPKEIPSIGMGMRFQSDDKTYEVIGIEPFTEHDRVGSTRVTLIQI